jgi:peptidoglycan/LPS O-acetylase OafA/YrhL
LPWNRRFPLGALLSGPRLPALDGLRMVAVILVIVGHAGWEAFPADLGVSAFFVLSGFLITWLLMKERERTGSVGLRVFYVRRAYRLLPAYYAFLAVALARHFAAPGARTDVVMPALLYYTNYFNAIHDHPMTPVSHLWSLAVEEQFYLFWPVAFAVFSRGSRALVVRFLVGAIATVALFRSWLFLGREVGTAWVYNAFDCRFDTLAVGCLAAVLSQEDRFLAVARAASRNSALPLVTIALLLASRLGGPDGYHYSIGFTVDALLLALLMVQLMQLSGSGAWAWLDHRVPRYVGAISYPMYLWNGYAISAAHRVAQGSFIGTLAAAVAIAVALGSASYYGIEKPFLRLRDRRARALSNPSAPASM